MYLIMYLFNRVNASQITVMKRNFNNFIKLLKFLFITVIWDALTLLNKYIIKYIFALKVSVLYPAKKDHYDLDHSLKHSHKSVLLWKRVTENNVRKRENEFTFHFKQIQDESSETIICAEKRQRKNWQINILK